ncbi:MAG: glycoside hydrolase family 15 protein, partial [Firmicutes bacterium]|nr:glycoside hydrolase family 15 protein [Bacillota bacterium]
MADGEAFGWPGLDPTWTSSAKDLVSTPLGASRVWITLGHGILNEVYWPATDRPQIRDLGFLIAGEGWWAEVKRLNRYRISTPGPEIPLARVVHLDERYKLELEFLPLPLRDAVLIRYRLEGLNLRLYALLAPHLGRSGRGNTAWVEDRGLFAAKGTETLALVADAGFSRASAGFVGHSDGWQDFHRNGAMTWTFARAENGNVALMGELAADQGLLALAFSLTPEGAYTLAASSLAEGWQSAREHFIQEWRTWGTGLVLPGGEAGLEAQGKLSAAVLRVHEDRTYPGAVVASLSIPWGDSRDDAGGYHLVWPRDAAEVGFALLASGLTEDARRMLAYLIARQQRDGSWPQNFFLDGTPYWTGIQLDETAFPVLLAAKLKAEGSLGALEPLAGEMVRKAVRYLAVHGPYSPEDRWEENAGANPFTLAVLIAALTAAANLGFLAGAEHDYALSLADNWNARVEEWTYVEGTDLDGRYGTRGHYVRITPPYETALRG